MLRRRSSCAASWTRSSTRGAPTHGACSRSATSRRRRWDCRAPALLTAAPASGAGPAGARVRARWRRGSAVPQPPGCRRAVWRRAAGSLRQSHSVGAPPPSPAPSSPWRAASSVVPGLREVCVRAARARVGKSTRHAQEARDWARSLLEERLADKCACGARRRGRRGVRGHVCFASQMRKSRHLYPKTRAVSGIWRCCRPRTRAHCWLDAPGRRGVSEPRRPGAARQVRGRQPRAAAALPQHAAARAALRRGEARGAHAGESWLCAAGEAAGAHADGTQTVDGCAHLMSKIVRTYKMADHFEVSQFTLWCEC